MNSTKAVEWAYPSSPNAKGFPHGCWVVETGCDPVFKSTSFGSAVMEARKLPGVWRNEAGMTIQCVDPETKKTGCWLFLGSSHREFGSRISPVFGDCALLFQWAKDAGWHALPGSGTLRWSQYVKA